MEQKRKLNIALVCDPIGNSKAGVVVSTLRFGKLLQERGNHVIFIGAKSKEYRGQSYYDGVRTYRFRSLPIPKSGGWHTAFPTVGELMKIFKDERIEIVHITIPMSAAIVAIKAARALGIKIVAHSHSQPENVFMNMPKFMRPLLYSLWNKFLVWIYGKAELLIYPTEMAHSLLNKLSRKGQPSAVISNGIDLREYRQMEVGNFYERFNVPKDDIKLLFVGRLFPEKSIDTLIKAMPLIIKDHPKTHLMIVGGGYMRGKLESLVQELKVAAHVTFLGLVSDEDKLLAFNACDIFVLPSLAELEGMVVLEAMACGKPIIIADTEMSASRYFVDGNGFLFKALDYTDLAEQALKLITDSGLRKKMGEKSLEDIQHYDIRKSVDMLEEAYHSALLPSKNK